MHLLFLFFRSLPSAPCLGASHFASSEVQADKAPSLSVQKLVLQSHRDGPVSRPFLWSSAISFYWGFRVFFVWRSWRTRKEFVGAAFLWSFVTRYLSHALNSEFHKGIIAIRHPSASCQMVAYLHTRICFATSFLQLGGKRDSFCGCGIESFRGLGVVV